jgi:predicted ribosome quality control (RQC) complex YloA/Tae2 family protein
MSFDGNMLHYITSELNEQLTSGRIVKIYQLSPYDLLFNIHKQKTKHQLFISASPNYARIHLTKFDIEKPDTPPNFCMFLRKHIEGSFIKDVSQYQNDRVIKFTLDTRNELGDKIDKFLIIEVTGRHANIIVTDQDLKILEAIKHIMPFEGTSRTIYPGAIYKYPYTDKINPFDLKQRNNYLESTTEFTNKKLLNTFMGFSPLVANEIIHRYEQGIKIKQVFEDIFTPFKPNIIESDKDYFYFTDITSIEGNKKYYGTVNDMLDRYYYERDKIDVIRQKSKDIYRFINNQIDKQYHKIEKLTKDLRNTNKMDSFKIKGELIQANLYQIKKGDTLLKTLNYYDNTPIEISLDPKKSPIENMEQYFKKYKKQKTSIPYLEKEIQKAKKERIYFEELLGQIEIATLKDIEEIKDELVSHKYIKSKDTKKKRKNKPNFDTYFDSEGIEILVGKNNIQNDYITHKLARHNEVWFHAKGAPGSHVIVKAQMPLTETTIRTASQLAAYFSKYRKSSSVPIDYVEKRYLKKVPGTKGSFVTYTNNKTIYIDPDEDFILNLRKKN